MRKWAGAIAVLLIFALPLQGFAAALRATCSLGHDRSDARSAPLPDHSAQHHHGMEPLHEHADTSLDADGGPNPGVNSDCTCGTCGLGPAAVLDRIDTTLRLPAAAPVERAIYPHIHNITGGPERPPRHILA